jgi:DNA-binding transcriptional regulator YhcF (GntR family)
VLAENPYCTVRGAAGRLKVAFTTAQRAVAKLEELKIVRQANEAKRDRAYCAARLLEILEEPAKVSAKEHA